MTLDTNGRIAGKTALISGGASGIGFATATRFIKEGAKVMITDVDKTRGAQALGKLGSNARFLVQDVTEEAGWDRVVEATTNELGPLDILVNCAGVFWYGTIENTSYDLWKKVLAINLDGTFLGCRAAVTAMTGHGGSIINLSSTSGLRGFADCAAYDASKGGVRLLTKSVALYCARERTGIRCNSVHPGGTDTKMVRDWFDDRGDAKAEEQTWINGTPIGRLGRPEEIASMILFLASQESGFVTGAEFVIDGGKTAA